jgi:starvation-inducible DNA-binding protein
MKDHSKVVRSLSQTLAEEYILMLKTQNFHWNVEGPLFYSLHMLFEQHYTFLATQVDLIAERIRAIGERAPGSYKEFLQLSKVEEAPPEHVVATKMIEVLTQDHQSMAERLSEFRAQADQNGDNTTVSMYDDLISFHEKSAWMIGSHRS